MHRAVDIPGCGFRGIGPIQGFLVIGIDQQQITGTHTRKMTPVRVDQKLAAVIVDCVAVVIGNGLMHIKPGGPPEDSGQIASRLIVWIFLDFGCGFNCGNGHA